MADKLHTAALAGAPHIEESAPGRNALCARWYVVHTQPSAEGRAIAHLERQAFTVFCPRYRKVVRHARKTASVLLPLFPSYLFVCLDLSRDRWRSINGTRGVARLIAHGDVPQPVLPGVVEALRSRASADGAMNWVPSLRVGQAVRIAEGPFADLVGTLERLGAAGRVSMLLGLFGRSVPVRLDGEVLDPAA